MKLHIGFGSRDEECTCLVDHTTSGPLHTLAAELPLDLRYPFSPFSFPMTFIADSSPQ
jgi:hypothetical protein